MITFEYTQDMRNYLDLIDKQYYRCKSEGISRLSIEWGVWSRKMNIEIRSKIKLDDDQSTGYKYIFNYWATKSQLLELHYKSKILRASMKKKLAETAKVLKEIILSGGNELQKIGK
jgi:hypothetical protein